MDILSSLAVRDVTTEQELAEHIHQHENGGITKARIASNGAINVFTGKRTGRSPMDRYLVRGVHDSLIDWGPINRAYERDAFEYVWERACAHAQKLSQSHPLFRQRLRAGADPKYSIRLTVYTKYAWHALFARYLFIRDAGTSSMDEWTILNLPSFHTDPVSDGVNSDSSLFIDLDQRRILIAGLRYAGEMKKAVFTVMNFLMPLQGALPMHCSANVGENGSVALLFGLSGTGKTTLGTDSVLAMIGDDEHVLTRDGVFNIEGGCYPKLFNLTEEREPDISRAIKYALMENVVLDPMRHPKFEDGSITENTRGAYPREHIGNRDRQNRASHPSAVIFLTCDAYGVMPPVARLSPEQAVYHYLSGYTAQVGSTVVGATSPISATFSAFFGAAFFPQKPEVYAGLFERMIREYTVPVFIVNTGWTGGPYGHADGRRYSIATSRRMVHAVLSGELDHVPHWHMDELNLDVPEYVHGVEQRHFRPRDMWDDKGTYDRTLAELVVKFHENWGKKFSKMPEEIRAAGPRL